MSNPLPQLSTWFVHGSYFSNKAPGLSMCPPIYALGKPNVMSWNLLWRPYVTCFLSKSPIPNPINVFFSSKKIFYIDFQQKANMGISLIYYGMSLHDGVKLWGFRLWLCECVCCDVGTSVRPRLSILSHILKLSL